MILVAESEFKVSLKVFYVDFGSPEEILKAHRG